MADFVKKVKLTELENKIPDSSNLATKDQSFSFDGSGFGQNVLIFGVDMSSSAHIDNKKINNLVLGKGSTQGLQHTLTAKKCTQLILL